MEVRTKPDSGTPLLGIAPWLMTLATTILTPAAPPAPVIIPRSQSGISTWIWPAAIGGVALAAVGVFAKKRKKR